MAEFNFPHTGFAQHNSISVVRNGHALFPYFAHAPAKEEMAKGKMLGFVIQEVGREINTLGTKANDATIQQLVISMKDELEKAKEQILNIL